MPSIVKYLTEADSDKSNYSVQIKDQDPVTGEKGIYMPPGFTKDEAIKHMNNHEYRDKGFLYRRYYKMLDQEGIDKEKDVMDKIIVDESSNTSKV